MANLAEGMADECARGRTTAPTHDARRSPTCLPQRGGGAAGSRASSRHRRRAVVTFAGRDGDPMPFDIDALTEAELVDLNHRIVERLRFLLQMKSHKQMLDFSIGDRVIFQPAGRPP